MSETDCSITPSQVSGRSPAVKTDNAGILEELLRSIDLGQGEFSLLFARCNYSDLRQNLLAELCEKLELQDISLVTLTLSPTETSMYDAIANRRGDTQAIAVSIVGLNTVDKVDDVLADANYLRESFRQHFPFPVLLWVDDHLLVKIRKRMPDFKSWGATTLLFDWDTDTLLMKLQATCDRYVEGALQHAAFTPLTEVLTPQEVRESEFAMVALAQCNVSLPPDILGSVELNRGSSLYGETPRPNPNICEAALAHYEASLRHWETAQNTLGVGLAQFYCSVCYAHRGNWKIAKEKRQACLVAFEVAERSDLLARFVGSLGCVLVELEDWDELAKQLSEWKTLHAKQPLELARDWSLQAEVSQHEEDWPQMQAHAEQAIKIWSEHISFQTVPIRFYLQQAEALAQQGQKVVAIEHIETVRRSRSPRANPEAFVQLLEQLRGLYSEAKKYRRAFEIKQERRGIQYQFQMRAFIGAGQLQAPNVADPMSETHFSFVASGRQSDIDTLVNVRVSQPRHKLTVLCGLSGVGKSSLVRAGLVPALQDKQLRDRRALTVVVRVYSDWEAGLGEALYSALVAYPDTRLKSIPKTAAQLKMQLRQNAKNRLLTVLVFDQFEEFFFICKQPAQRQQFYEFLRDCLKGTEIQFVKVIFSLREDYLHELLEFEDYVKDLGFDFLSREQRQRIENFTPSIARSVITELSQRTTPKLDNDLVDALVDSLTNELGHIRPVELQVVGAQLEAEGVVTLAQYQELGDNPKLFLAERWVEAVVKDCGPENMDAAWQVLVALTQENGTRPLLTQEELSAALEDYQQLMGTSAVSLEQDILPVLVGAGLVVRWPQKPEDRYQLVHDYLVEPIRRRYNADYRQQLQQLVQDKQAAEERQRQEEERRKQFQRWTLRGALGATALFAGLAIFAWQAAIQANRLVAESEQAKLVAVAQQLMAQSERIQTDDSSNFSEAVLLAVEAFNQLNRLKHPTLETEALLRSYLKQLPSQIKIIPYRTFIRRWQFSNDGRLLVTLDEAGTVKLIDSISSQELIVFRAESPIRDWGFSDDGQFLVTLDEGGTVKLIDSTNGQEPTTVQSELPIRDWKFSQNGQFLAIQDEGGTVKLIDSTNGQEPTTVRSESPIRDWRFSDDGQFLVTLDEGGTVKLIDSTNGQELTTVQSESPIRLWRFSENSQFLAIQDEGGTVKLIDSTNGQELTTVQSELPIRLWRFSENSQFLAIQDEGGTVKLIDSTNGQELTTVQSELPIRDWKFSENDQFLAIQDEGGTVKLIDSTNGQELTTVQSELPIRDWEFSENSQFLAIQDEGGTVKFINSTNGQELTTVQSKLPIRDWKFSENGQFLITLDNVGKVKLIDSVSDQELENIKYDGLSAGYLYDDWPHKRSGSNYALSSIENRFYFTVVGKTSVSFIEVSNDSDAKTYDSKGPIRKVKFSEDGRYLATLNVDGVVSIITSTDTDTQKVLKFDFPVTSIDFNADSTNLVVSSRDGTVLFVEASTGKMTKEMNFEASVRGVSFSSDGHQFAVNSSDDSVTLIESRSGREIKTVKHSLYIRGAIYSNDNKYLVTYSEDRQARLIKTSNGEEIKNFKFRAFIKDVLFSPDSKHLAMISQDGKTNLVRSFDGKKIKTFEYKKPIKNVLFSQDGKYLALINEGNIVNIIDVFSGREIRALEYGIAVDEAVFTANSQFIAVNNIDGTVKLVEINSGREIRSLRNIRDVTNLSFSSNNQYLATASRNGTVRLILLSTLEEIQTLTSDLSIDRLDFSPNARYLLIQGEQNFQIHPILSTAEIVDNICERIQQNLPMNIWERYIGTPKTYEKTCPKVHIHASAFAKASELIAKETAAINVDAKRFPDDIASEFLANIEDPKHYVESRMLLEKYRVIEPNIDLFPQTSETEQNLDFVLQKWLAANLLSDGQEALVESLFELALLYFVVAQKLDSEIDISTDKWSRLFWNSLLGKEVEVSLRTCEAVLQYQPENGDYLSMCGIARALNGDLAGAIEDFQAYINWNDSSPRRKRQHQEWIYSLQAGETIFTEDFLQELRKE
ncbi:NACHT and WD repeat domain-containing protein [Leptothoe spongobia]|uniref:AAA family ATPase n=1 Tax=Leptothoe spongobia TAU-MAC 1115 TaxID=1967444 RepID=A0A947DEE3_9CYAN|nr:NACHT and WD repeat domain-containing protein [Leptothoe spongobia]MBT9315109.1 AAA family ATPase [Leptothoe spongobia TAU-MAC 1115]